MPDLPPQAVQAARAVLDHPWAGTPKSAHAQHRYDAGCGVCRGDVPAILAVAAPHIAGHGLVVVRAEDGAGRRLLAAVEPSGTAPEPTETGRDAVSQVLGSTDDPRTVETPTALPRGVRDCQVCRRQTEDQDGICAVCRFVDNEELAGLRQRVGHAEAQVNRVREWAEKMRRTGNPDGMGAHIHATVTRLLDQPATEETP